MSEWRKLSEEYPFDQLHFWICGGHYYEDPMLISSDDFSCLAFRPTHWAPCDPPAWPLTTGQEGE